MTSHSIGSARYFTSYEEAKAAGKPSGKEDWKLYCYTGLDKDGNPVTLWGYTGGAAVLGWQLAVAVGGWTATLAEKAPKSVDPKAVLDAMSPEARAALLAAYMPQPQPQPEPQPNQDQEPSSKRRKS